jgi:hypothetical protein
VGRNRERGENALKKGRGKVWGGAKGAKMRKEGAVRCGEEPRKGRKCVKK